MPQFFHSTVKELLDQRLSDIESHFDADVIFYWGQIAHPLIKLFRDQIERLRPVAQPKDRLVIILGTSGGSAEVVEKLVEIIRYYYG